MEAVAENTTVSDRMFPDSNNGTVFSTDDSSMISPTPGPSTGFVVGMVAVMVLLAVTGTTLNGVVLLAIALNKRLRTASAWFVANLAAGDLLETAVYLPFSVFTAVTHRAPCHPTLCAAFATISISNKFISLSCMALIAFHRFMLITKSTATYRALFTTRNNVLIALLAWLVSWTAVIPFFLGYGSVKMNRAGICAATSMFVSTRAVFGVLYAVPLLAMLYSYVAIYRYVRNASYNIENPCRQNLHSKNRLQVAKSLAVLACVFCVLVGPACIALVFTPSWSAAVSALVWSMYYANCCINAFLHIRKNPDFKEACRKLFFCISLRREKIQDCPRREGLGASAGCGTKATSSPHFNSRPSPSQPLTPQLLTLSIRLEPRAPCYLPSVST